jgi:hypothetical protein
VALRYLEWEVVFVLGGNDGAIDLLPIDLLY